MVTANGSKRGTLFAYKAFIALAVVVYIVSDLVSSSTSISFLDRELLHVQSFHVQNDLAEAQGCSPLRTIQVGKIVPAPAPSSSKNRTSNVAVTDNMPDPKKASCDDLMDRFHSVIQAFHTGTKSVNPPLINYGFYSGQGFGRLVDHSMMHCLLSLALDRPCLVDLSGRDPYYTWRSFIHTGSYDWELEKTVHRSLVASVRSAVEALPAQGSSAWPNTTGLIDENVQPMEKLDWPPGKTQRRDFWNLIEPWRPGHTPKALLSPNWGKGWFPDLTFPTRYASCPHNELVTRIQNAMYQPTPLSHKLHTEQRLKVLNAPLRPYGAIHIRFVILQIEKRAANDDEILQALEATLQEALRQTNLTEWWLISDKPARAISLAAKLPKEFSIFHHPEVKDATGFVEHSNNDRARGVFGHASMSESILDWMVLHESDAAIVTHGSYGDTGARGRGKVMRSGKDSMFRLHTP